MSRRMAAAVGSCKDELRFQDLELTSRLRRQLLSLRKERQHTDVTLTTEDGVDIHCHKVALSAASDYFLAMFSYGLKENASGVVSVHDIDGPTMEAVVDYMYTGEISITPDNVQRVAQACGIYHLGDLKAVCEQYMITRTNPRNAIGLYRFAKMYSLSQLRDVARSTMMTNFRGVVRGPEFLDLSEGELLEYIKADALDVTNEDRVLEAVFEWTGHALDARSGRLASILSCVRLPFCSGPYLSMMAKCSIVVTNLDCQKSFVEALADKLSPEQSLKQKRPKSVPRRSFRTKRRLVIVGGEAKNCSTNQQCWILNEQDRTWDMFSEIPNDTKFYSICSYNGNILFTGGTSNTKGCLLYNTREKKWKKLSAMLEGRIHHTTVSYGTAAYAIGGQRTSQILRSVERFDPELQKWTHAPPLGTAVRDAASASTGRYLYVFGGIIDFQKKESVNLTQVYDTIWEEWSTRSPMLEACHAGSAVGVDEKIFLVGGNTNRCVSYDPLADQWTQLTRPREYHRFGSSVLWRGKIVVAGGEDPLTMPTSTMEQYDPEQDSWETCRLPLKMELRGHGILVIDVADEDT